MRQHVNPLSARYQRPIQTPNWAEVFQDMSAPLHLDIGCARGQFLLKMASAHPHQNFIGVEIREPLVIAATAEQQQLQLRNLAYLFGNINFESEQFFAALPGSLEMVTIQFPDPWFKHKHHKRRVAQPELLQGIAKFLKPEGRLFIQSDIFEVVDELRRLILKIPAFVATHEGEWLDENPLPVATEREEYVQAQNLPVYRALFQKVG